MNDKLAALLEQLAIKLGTTVDYLWKVLVKQAYIDATKHLVILIATIAYAFVIIRIHKSLIKKDKHGDTKYDESELWIPVMSLFILSWTILFIASISGVSDIFNGYFNPEYWALKEILDTIN